MSPLSSQNRNTRNDERDRRIGSVSGQEGDGRAEEKDEVVARDSVEYRNAPPLKEKIRLQGRRHVSDELYAEHTCENVPVSRLPSCFCVMSRCGLLPSTPRARVVDPVLL